MHFSITLSNISIWYPRKSDLVAVNVFIFWNSSHCIYKLLGRTQQPIGHFVFFTKIGNYPILCIKVVHTPLFYYFILKFEIQLLQVHGSAKVATWSGKYKACDTCGRSVIACANGRQMVFACMVPCCPVVPLTSVVASTSSTRYTEMGWVRGNPSR
jgi:hypothetical protein